MPIGEVEILTIRKMPSGDPSRIGQLDMMVSYKIGTGPANICYYPASEHSEERMKKAIKENEEQQAELVGKKFTIE
ncbi:hypothetical protein ES703_29028 [subsurface metagenome]